MKIIVIQTGIELVGFRDNNDYYFISRAPFPCETCPVVLKKYQYILRVPDQNVVSQA